MRQNRPQLEVSPVVTRVGRCRFVRARDDKSPEQATTAQQIAQMYLAQDQLKNTTAKHNYNMDDFY